MYTFSKKDTLRSSKMKAYIDYFFDFLTTVCQNSIDKYCRCTGISLAFAFLIGINRYWDNMSILSIHD